MNLASDSLPSLSNFQGSATRGNCYYYTSLGYLYGYAHDRLREEDSQPVKNVYIYKFSCKGLIKPNCLASHLKCNCMTTEHFSETDPVTMLLRQRRELNGNSWPLGTAPAQPP